MTNENSIPTRSTDIDLPPFGAEMMRWATCPVLKTSLSEARASITSAPIISMAARGRPLPTSASLSEPIQLTGHAVGASAEDLEGKSILVVDDDRTIRESLADVLKLEGYETRVAESGRVAVQQVLERAPDLILLDLNMPDTDGWQAFEIMARLVPSVPVVVITARPFQARRAAEVGIDMLLEKPLDIPTLVETVRLLLRSPGESMLGHVLRTWHTNDLSGTQG